jgi:glutamate dehydrogenase
MARKTAEAGLAREIAERIRASLLPGDTPFADGQAEAAAGLLLATAQEREPGRPAIAIETSAGQAGRMMRIALVNDDMPFLVDSVAAAVAAQGLAIARLVHPVLPVRRDAAGKLVEVLDGDGSGEKRESMIYLETDRTDARNRRRLAEALQSTLSDVRAAVTDWPRMRAAMESDAEDLANPEGAALLRWLQDDMLTQLGHVVRRRDGSQSGALGICRKGVRALLSPESFERAFAWFETGKGKGKSNPAGDNGPRRAPLIVKSNHLSQVHRRVPLDLFIVPRFEGDRVSALSVHAGVWTSAALAAPPDLVPRLRAQLAMLNARFGFDPGGHAGKALVHALTKLPHDLLIGFEDTDLERVVTAMMSLVDRPRPKLALVRAPLHRHLFAFVWLPRDALSTAIRLQVQRLLVEGTGAEVLDWSLEVEGGNLALLRFVLDVRGSTVKVDEEALDASLGTLVRGWGEAVESELARTIEPMRAAALAGRYADAFPLAYRSEYGAGEAAIDIARLRTMPEAGRSARLYRLPADPLGSLRLKLYQPGQALPLSDAVPALENFGFRVIAETATSLASGQLGTIHDFVLELRSGIDPSDLLDRAEAIEGAVAAVLAGLAEDDPFNRLVAGSGIAAREAEWLQAWYRYLRQAGMGFGIGTAVDALANAPAVTRGLVDLFVARHDAAFHGSREAAEKRADTAIREGLARVSAINDDRLLRAFRGAVEAILRTNAFAPAPGDDPIALAFKLDSKLVPGLPKPVPWREIFVYSRRVEGIHLRSGPIARGGIRWSDRRDDFRTEVLGLMKAQRVKNAVIVPTGAKGGFYPKQLPSPAVDRDGWLAEGKASYQLFVRTLLTVTDNIVGGKVVHPPGVVIHDGEDPYFVVAADKGTASFSDTANAIADEFDFWLDDAFASGGSKGYDHKAMGITARGAWLSVRRHFLEMGVDVQAEPIRVAGCGDMSGDVFGNGMLLSQAIKLVAAFDHRHVFLDPDPDPAKSWAERQRLFDLPRSSWDDYDRTLISQGGGVFARSLKSIPLSPQVRKMLEIEEQAVDPDTLIAALLRAPVDLWWFGGIGTYLKAEAENNVQVGDPANDAIRVNGSEMRARAIGEGANLGVTQAGRIEYALSGGRINTDFIDNSAGVDCSDNEVNIKIALAGAKRAGRLTEPARVRLLRAMTDEVAALVLEDNRLQALALSIAEANGPRATASHVRLIETLEDTGNLDRRTEGIADSETLARRAADDRGLTRPELAVVLSSTKLVLQDAIEESPLPDDPMMADELLAAFPAPMRKRFRRDILEHRLRREIIATKLANRMVNRLGLIHPFELVEEEGVTLGEAAAAFVAAEHLFDMRGVWRRIETAQMPETARVLLFDRAAHALRTHMADLLRSGASFRPSKLVADLESGVAELSSAAKRLLNAEGKAQSQRMRDQFAEAGVPDDEGALVARLFDMDGAIGLAKLASDSKLAAPVLTRAFSDLGARLGLDWAQGTAARMSPSDPWERLLVSGLARDFQQMRLEFLRRATTGRAKAPKDPAEAVARWATAQEPAIRQFRAMVGRAEGAVPVAPAMLAQIASQARNLLAR